MSLPPGRKVIIVVSVVTAAVLTGLVLFFRSVGLDPADKYASVGALFAAILGISMAVVDRRTTDSPGAEVFRPSMVERALDRVIGAQQRVAAVDRRLKVVNGSVPAGVFRKAVLLALRHDPARARTWVSAMGPLVSDADLRAAFSLRDIELVAATASSADLDALVAAAELADRLHVPQAQMRLRDRTAAVLANTPDPFLIAEFQEHSDRWVAFLSGLPPELVPRSFEVALFCGRIDEAIELVGTPDQAARVLTACRGADSVEVVTAGLRLAHTVGNAAAISALEERAGELLFAQRRYDAALEHFRNAGRLAKQSECYEKLGRIPEALRTCPQDNPQRISALVVSCRTEVEHLVDAADRVGAAELIALMLARIDDAGRDVADLGTRRAEVTTLRATLIREARTAFGRSVLEPDANRPAVYLAWSQFESAAGEIADAARRAEDGGYLVRAALLFEEAGLYGEVVRVREHDDSPQNLIKRAEARAKGGDTLGAAEDYRQAHQWRAAADAYLAMHAYEQAALCLSRLNGDRAVEDPDFVRCLRSTGEFEQLTRLCIEAIARSGRDTAAVGELRQLVRERHIPAALRDEVQEALDRIEGRNRAAFEARAQAWVARAAAKVDKRFAPAWGLDLGTSTCMVAIYDRERRVPVLCPWRGEIGFPSTLSIDVDGHELVGLRGDEITANLLRATITDAKRDMGTDKTYTTESSYRYRPEEVSARFIQHARSLVESMLSQRVRELVAEFARDELGDVREEWLNWAEHEHPVRLERPRVLVTIPAYFPIKAKNATRDACAIAGVTLVRLIHEPTAACVAAAFEKTNIEGDVVIVDLGAGTLDISLLEVADRVYMVRRLLGQVRFGGRDFDSLIARALTQRLRRAGEAVPETREARHRLQVAAEALKIALATQTEAEYQLYGFGGRDMVLRLTRAELEEILAEPMQQLRQVCAEARAAHGVDHLVLVGAPILSPLVRERIESAFARPQTRVAAPRTAVAHGAALQAAALDHLLESPLLLDVTPFALGIRTRREKDESEFTVLVEANATIPVKSTKQFTTFTDNQDRVYVEIYNGALHPESLIGEFILDGIAPAPRGKPLIDVTFDIDASCVLTVTATNRETGKAQSIRIEDTTLLSPSEIGAMTARHNEVVKHQNQLARLADVRQQLLDLVAEADQIELNQLWAELERRKANFRVASGIQLSAETERALDQIFRTWGTVEREVTGQSRRLRELHAEAQQALGRRTGPNLDAESAVLEGKINALRTALTAGRRLRQRLTTWFVILTEAAADVLDPLRQFRDRYDHGDFRGAQNAVHGTRLTEPADQERLLHALAETRNRDGYSAALAEMCGGTAELFARVGSAAPTIAAQSDRSDRTGNGLLVALHLVLTSSEWLSPSTTARIILPDGFTAVATATSTNINEGVALLRLTERAPDRPLPRLGYGSLLRVGDRLLVPGHDGFQPGLLEEFLTVSDERPALVKVSFSDVDPTHAGLPIVNESGEVVGLIIATNADERYAVGLVADLLRRIREIEPAT